MMRPFSLALSWMAFAAIGSEGAPQGYIPPQVMEKMCQDAEASFSGPRMPRILALIFSGRGCPSAQARIGHNCMGMWSCYC